MSDRSTSARPLGTICRVGVAGAALGPGALGAPGVAGPALGGRDRLRDRTNRRAAAGGGPVELVANEVVPAAGGDPRLPAVLEALLCSESHECGDARAALLHTTVRSGQRVAVAMDHRIEGPSSSQVSAESFPDLGRVTITAALEPGERLRVVKFVAYGWSADRSGPALRDQVAAALAGASRMGWDALAQEQHAYLDDFWNRADVEVDGDAEIQQAVRFSLFHVLQAGARAEGRAIPAKGLTGPGYDGHAFWDTETYVLPVLTYTAPTPLPMLCAGATARCRWPKNEHASSG